MVKPELAVPLAELINVLMALVLMEIKNIVMMCRILIVFVFPLLLLGCSRNPNNTLVSLSFEQNTINQSDEEFICYLSEEKEIIGLISDFAIIDDSSFVVCDGRNVLLYSIDGELKNKFGTNGRARGEMISPSNLFVKDGVFYIWCSSLLKLVIFDNDANLIDEITGFETGVKKFVIDGNLIYFYNTGHLNDSSNAFDGVINVYDLDRKEFISEFGSRSKNDEVMFAYRNSGGMGMLKDKFIYMHPGNLIIYEKEPNSDVENMYIINDDDFNSEKIEHHKEITENRNKWIDYLRSNSSIRGIWTGKDRFVICAETGSLDANNRRIKLYMLDINFNPIKTISFEYRHSPNIVVHSDYMYLLENIISKTEDQSVNVLKRWKIN